MHREKVASGVRRLGVQSVWLVRKWEGTAQVPLYLLCLTSLPCVLPNFNVYLLAYTLANNRGPQRPLSTSSSSVQWGVFKCIHPDSHTRLCLRMTNDLLGRDSVLVTLRM